MLLLLLLALLLLASGLLLLRAAHLPAGPPAGVGARARTRAKLPGPKDWVEMEVISGRRPETIVEQSVGAKGRRRTRGTYRLDALPGGGTNVRFEFAYVEGPLSERLVVPLMRSWLIAGHPATTSDA